jgi:pyrimidine operon attenuation protein/uracil phosphoribosyltransferase
MQEAKRIEGTELVAAIRKIGEAIWRDHAGTKDLVIVGIADGGIGFGQALARDLQKRTKRDIRYGTVNITFHRDDIARKPIPKPTRRTQLPLDIEGANIILADDVIFTGRSVRAAINEIFDQGRPACVQLAILCDRGNRRLPIQPNYLGFCENTTPEQNVVLEMDPDALNASSLCIYNP